MSHFDSLAEALAETLALAVPREHASETLIGGSLWHATRAMSSGQARTPRCPPRRRRVRPENKRTFLGAARGPSQNRPQTPVHPPASVLKTEKRELFCA